MPGDTNGKEDVYEYEPTGVPQGPHQCTAEADNYDPRSEGCLGLICSGSASRESAFLDATETGGEGPGGEELAEGGGDVFFITAAKLVPEDTDEAYDVYDAHECTSASPCIPAPEMKPRRCAKRPRPAVLHAPGRSLGAPASAAPGAPGTPARAMRCSQARNTTSPNRKQAPHRAQRLAKALHACRSKDKHHKHKRLACERAAHKRYSAGQGQEAKNAGTLAPGRADDSPRLPSPQDVPSSRSLPRP